MPQRFKLTIAYDGTKYAGWQVQPKHRTVQGELERAMEEVCRHKVRLESSGRTDRGVHALGQVAHVDIQPEMQPKRLRLGVNALLEADIRIMEVRKVAPDFHARFHATGKEYRYFIWNDDVREPCRRFYSYWIRDPLNLHAMRQAAAMLEGTHDFAAFTASSRREIKSTTRTVDLLRVSRWNGQIMIRVRGDGFLYKMVRSLAGHLIRVGRGHIPPELTHEILDSKIRTARVPTAGAEGLFLWRVYY